MKAICMDTSGWLEIAIDGANSKAFAKALAASAPLIVSAISLYEISKYVAREVDQDTADELIAFIKQHAIIDITPELALSAATLSARHKLAMADSLIYATAIAHNATLWTQDVDFEGLPNVKYYPKKKS